MDVTPVKTVKIRKRFLTTLNDHFRGLVDNLIYVACKLCKYGQT